MNFPGLSPIKYDGTAGEPVALPTGYSAFDGVELDAKGNIYVSEIVRNEIWVSFARRFAAHPHSQHDERAA